MTTEEQILEAASESASDRVNSGEHVGDFEIAYTSFIDGAKWMQAHGSIRKEQAVEISKALKALLQIDGEVIENERDKQYVIDGYLRSNGFPDIE